MLMRGKIRHNIIIGMMNRTKLRNVVINKPNIPLKKSVLTNISDRVINIHNKHHLGDQVFNIIYFNKIAEYLKTNNITILYYLQPRYINQVSEFLLTENVKLLPLNGNNLDVGIHFWIGNTSLIYNNHSPEYLKFSYNKFYVKFFNFFSRSINIPANIQSLAYTDPDLLIRYEKLNDKYKNIDLLIVNSVPLSKQLVYNESEWIQFVKLFANKYNIVTTKKVDTIKCTLDDKLTIKDIAALSTKAKVIIAVNTGVVPGLLNEYTINNVKAFYSLDLYVYYNLKNFASYRRLNALPIKRIFKILDENVNTSDVLV